LFLVRGPGPKLVAAATSSSSGVKTIGVELSTTQHPEAAYNEYLDFLRSLKWKIASSTSFSGTMGSIVASESHSSLIMFFSGYNKGTLTRIFYSGK
jgi:hypothetical protein